MYKISLKLDTGQSSDPPSFSQFEDWDLDRLLRTEMMRIPTVMRREGRPYEMMAGVARVSLMRETILGPGLWKPSLAQRRGTSLVLLILSRTGKAGSGWRMAESWKLICMAMGMPSGVLMSRKMLWRSWSGLGGWVRRGLVGAWRPCGKETARGGDMSG